MTLLALIPCIPLASHASASTDEAELLFVRRIQPLLIEKCLSCHGNDESDIQGGLDVTLLRLLGLDDNKLTYLHAGRFKPIRRDSN